MTQTARLSGLFLYRPTDLSCSLATVTHGWEETEKGELSKTVFHKETKMSPSVCMAELDITVKTNKMKSFPKEIPKFDYNNGPNKENNITFD